MKHCTNCNNEIDDKLKFCNKSCAATYNNSKRTLSLETKEKISNSLKNNNRLYSRTTPHIETEKVKAGRLRAGAKRSKAALEKLMSDDFDTLGIVNKKKRVRIEQDHKCLNCGLSEWMGKPLTLEVDHIDGDNNNNVRENLRALCPNCHSQTETWRGTNARKIKITDEVLIEMIKESRSVLDVINKTGMSITRHSYKRINLLIEKHNLNFQ